MIDDFMLDKMLDKIKEIIGIEQFDDIKIFIDMDDKLPDDINFKNVVKFINCSLRDDGKFYPQIYLEEALFVK